MNDQRLHELAQHLETAGIALQQAAEVVEQLANGGAPAVIMTAAELDAALATAPSGATLLLDPELRYLTPCVLTASVKLKSAGIIPISRADRSYEMPRFADGLTINGENVTLLGIEIQRLDHLTDIVVINGAGCTLDGCRVLGDPTLGAKRGIAGNAPNVTVIRCYVDDCFGPMPGSDTQAFCAWDSPGPFRLEDNYFCGASETILFGGADPSSASNVPSDIVITGNTITKNPAWRDKAIVKNLVEFKNARRYRVEDNDLSYCWGGEQGGYAFMLTPRNQDGTAPYSEVRDGIIRNNRIAHVGALLAMNGSDNLHPSGPLDGLVFEANEAIDVDAGAYHGNDKIILMQSGPQHVTIHGNRVEGPMAGSALYFGEAPNTCVDLVFTNNTVPPSEYGVMGASCAPDPALNNAQGSAWTTYVQSGRIEGNAAI